MAFSLIAFLSQLQIKALPNLETFPLTIRIANSLVSYLSYIFKMFWPSKLSLFYPHHGTPPFWEVIAGGFIIAGISFMAIRAFKRHPYFTVGWFWYIISFLPVIGLIQIGLHAKADRYAYVPLIGLYIIISWGTPSLIGRWRHQKMVLRALAALIIPILMFCTWIQLGRWKNSFTIFEHALRVTSNNYFIHNNLGSTFYRQGKTEKAIDHYLKAVQINPHYFKARYNLGIALVTQNNFEKAIDHFNHILLSSPNNENAHNDLGVALCGLGRFEEAVSHFSKALRIRTDFLMARANMEKALAAIRKSDEVKENIIKK